MVSTALTASDVASLPWLTGTLVVLGVLSASALAYFGWKALYEGADTGGQVGGAAVALAYVVSQRDDLGYTAPSAAVDGAVSLVSFLLLCLGVYLVFIRTR